jgi:hypothetical protein
MSNELYNDRYKNHITMIIAEVHPVHSVCGCVIFLAQNFYCASHDGLSAKYRCVELIHRAGLFIKVIVHGSKGLCKAKVPCENCK